MSGSVDLEVLGQLAPDQLRGLLPGFLAGFIAEPAASDRNRDRVAPVVADWSDTVCGEVLEVLRTLGDEQRLYRAHPACRVLSRTWCADVVLEPEAHGVDHLREAVAAGPTLVLSNHLSYFDTNATDAILSWSGHGDLADRLVTAAGPKVYRALFRRVAASCLHTLPVPQSTTFAHTDKLSVRELARQALASLDAARALLEEGLVLQLYPEGSRTRTGRLGSFLKATHRYVGAVEGLRVVPAAIVGTQRVMPVDEEGERLVPAPVQVRYAPALSVGPDGTARDVLAQTWERVRDLLPEDQQPPEDTVPTR